MPAINLFTQEMKDHNIVKQRSHKDGNFLHIRFKQDILEKILSEENGELGL